MVRNSSIGHAETISGRIQLPINGTDHHVTLSYAIPSPIVSSVPAPTGTDSFVMLIVLHDALHDFGLATQ